MRTYLHPNGYNLPLCGKISPGEDEVGGFKGWRLASRSDAENGAGSALEVVADGRDSKRCLRDQMLAVMLNRVFEATGSL
jgi:hypothetical protein